MNSYNRQELLDSDYIVQLIKDYGGLYTADEASIPLAYQSMSFDSLYPEMHEFKEKVFHYFWEQKKSLILWSKAPGAGKTLIAILACFAGMHPIIKKNMYTARFIDYTEIPDMTSFKDVDRKFWQETKKLKTWIIDDVQPYDSKHEIERKTNFKLFIKFLYNSGSKFIITTTMDKDELLDYFGPDTVSRLDERAVALKSSKSNVRDLEEKASNNVEKYEEKTRKRR